MSGWFMLWFYPRIFFALTLLAQPKSKAFALASPASCCKFAMYTGPISGYMIQCVAALKESYLYSASENADCEQSPG